MGRYEDLIKSFKAHMEKNPYAECCGIITKDFNYIPCKNISPSPADTFILDPVALLQYGEECWGIFHSHTPHHDELPSEKDKDSAIFSQYKFAFLQPPPLPSLMMLTPLELDDQQNLFLNINFVIH